MNLAEDTLRYKNGSALGVSGAASHVITNAETHSKPLAFSEVSPLPETPTLKNKHHHRYCRLNCPSAI